MNVLIEGFADPDGLSEEDNIKHKAGCVWTLLDETSQREEVERFSSYYGITYNDAMKWRDFYSLLKALKKERNGD